MPTIKNFKRGSSLVKGRKIARLKRQRKAGKR